MNALKKIQEQIDAYYTKWCKRNGLHPEQPETQELWEQELEAILDA